MRQAVDEILRGQPDLSYRRAGYIHLYGVAQTAAMLALRRGLNPELASIAGMLHDISTYHTGDPTDHDRHSLRMAREMMASTSLFTEGESTLVCQAIARHRRKSEVHEPFDELLKDADVLQHYLYNVFFKQAEKENARIASLRRELVLG